VDPDKFWWRIKVACGAALIINLVIYYLVPASAEIVPRPLAQALAVAGGAVTIFHHGLLKRARRDGDIPTLVTRGGLFHWIRHPMYTGDLLLYTGLTLLAPGNISVALLMLGSLALYKQARVEDAFLHALHGDAFLDWQRRTRLL
jgi:protein-S-isoprenylcysteine O-methyltransferase Ste14